MSSTKILFKPVQVGSHNLSTRIGMSALTRNRAANTYPTELMKEYYVQRASGGAGLIVSEGVLVSRQGSAWPNAPGIWDDRHISSWKTITDGVHDAGSKIYAQLWHCGRLCHPDAPEQLLAGEPVYGPSAIAARGGKFRQIAGEPGYVTPTPIDDPWKLVKLYKQAAINAKKAGFDGVEFQASSGVLPVQFLDSSCNQRTDEWGGSIERRAKFGLEVLKALIDVFGPDVALKVSPAGGYNDTGMPLQETLDTFSYFLSEADKLKLSFIVLVRYNARFDSALNNGAARGTDHDVLESYRPFIKHSKLFLNSAVTAEEGEALISAGKIDGIFVGTNWITHPDLVKRIAKGIPLDNVPKFALFQAPEADWSVGYTDYPIYDARSGPSVGMMSS